MVTRRPRGRRCARGNVTSRGLAGGHQLVYGSGRGRGDSRNAIIDSAGGSSVGGGLVDAPPFRVVRLDSCRRRPEPTRTRRRILL